MLNKKMAKESVIKEKSFNFAIRIVDLYKMLCENKEYVISKQLLRSGTSIGANVEEANAGHSKKDFIAKMVISSKEARETKYWIRLLNESKLVNVDLAPYLNDIEEIIKILTSIVKTSQENNNA